MKKTDKEIFSYKKQELVEIVSKMLSEILKMPRIKNELSTWLSNGENFYDKIKKLLGELANCFFQSNYIRLNRDLFIINLDYEMNAKYKHEWLSSQFLKTTGLNSGLVKLERYKNTLCINNRKIIVEKIQDGLSISKLKRLKKTFLGPQVAAVLDCNQYILEGVFPLEGAGTKYFLFPNIIYQKGPDAYIYSCPCRNSVITGCYFINLKEIKTKKSYLVYIE
jgi:hypothetical protein